MATVLQDTTVVGVVTQTQPASADNHLLRLGEAKKLLNSQFQGAWNANTIYSAQQGVNWQGSFYISNVDNNQGHQPDTNPTQWRLTAQGGQSAYIYIAYADDANGTGFTTTFNASKNFIAILTSTTAIATLTVSNFSGLWKNYQGQSYLYVAYASDTNGSNFSLTPGANLNYVAVLASVTAIANPTAANFTGLWKLFGAPSVYVAYADDANGTGFTTIFNASKNFIAILVTATPIIPQAPNFAGLWKNYQGQSYLYVAYASDANGGNFSLTPSSNLGYIAWLTTNTPITSPQASDFTGLWVSYQGTQGNPGQSAYIYIAYADDASGIGFTTTFNAAKNYIAIKATTAPIVSPQASDFMGLWKQYGSPVSVSGALTLTGGVLGLNAASAATANFLVQRDVNGSFSANVVSAASVIIGGSATLSFSAGALSINQPVAVNGLTVNGLSGVLKAAGGVVGGSATTNDLTEGGNLYFTSARVLATPLTGLLSNNILLASDTVLSAFGKLDNVLGGNFPAGTVAGNFSVTGNLAVTGNTTLKTSLNGILQATNGVVSGSATSDNVPEGTANLFFTNARADGRIVAQRGAANGIAPLDANSKVPLANLYAYGATAFGANSQSAMLNLGSAKQGDFCLRSDQNLTYVLNGSSPALLTNWAQLLYPVMSVNGATGTVVLTSDSIVEGASNLYFTNARADARIAAQRSAANGLCPLDANSLVPGANLPPIGNSVWIVNSQSTQTNLSNALKGDLCNRTDQNLTYILSNNAPSSFGSWVPLLYPVASVNGFTGAITLSTTEIAEGGNLYFTNARVIATTLTGFVASAGTVSASDTVLTALQKHEANINGKANLNGATLTGTLQFFGGSIAGLVVNNLTTSQINSLPAVNGSVVYDSTLGVLKFCGNGAWYPVFGAFLPLAGGSANKMTGALAFQDGLATAIDFGNNVWTMRTLNSNAEFDLAQNGTTALKVDTNNNVYAPHGWFDTINGVRLNGNQFLYLNNSANALDFGGGFGIYLNYNHSELDFIYNGQPALKIDTTANVTVLTGFFSSNDMTAGGWFNSNNGMKINGNRFVFSENSRAALDFGGNWKVTTGDSYATLYLGYNGSQALQIAQDSNVTFSNDVTAGGWFKSNSGLKVNGTQVVGGQQSHFSLPSLSGNYGSDYYSINNWMNSVQNLLQAHGLMAS